MQLEAIHRRLRHAVVVAALVAVTAPAVAGALELADVVMLSVKFKLPDEAIVSKIKKDGSVFKLTPDQVIDLKKQGLSDGLINFMLRTGGASYTAPTPGAVKKVDPKEPEKQLTEAEKVAEAERMKEEAMRLVENQRRREGAQRRAFANKVLKRGQALANAGRWVAAVKVFSDFVKNGVHGVPYPPDSDEAYNANYGIANALARAGLLQSAANKLLEVVRAGPDKIWFEKAFNQLRELRRRINYRPPELEDLTKFSVATKSKVFQNSFHYFVGEFLHDFGLSSEAIPFLEKIVDDKAPDYPRAQYLLGLIAFQDDALDVPTKVKRSSQAFQLSIISGETQGNQGLVDLAYLALARLAYEYRQYDAAIYYYKKISQNSAKLPRAFYESGWTYFLKNDISRALGTFHALHSPYFRHHFYPELWILEATIYVNTCHAKDAEEAIKRFEEDVLVLGPPLRDFLQRHRRPEDYYTGILKSVNSPRLATLPRKLVSPVLQNVEFYNLYKTIKQIEAEEAKVKANLAALKEFGQETLGKLGQLKSERIAEAGVVVQRTLRAVQKDINEYQDRLTELRIDLQEQQLEILEDKIARIETKASDAKDVETGSTIAIAGSDSMVWPFEGEFWKDEIGAYRSFVRSKCKAE